MLHDKLTSDATVRDAANRLGMMCVIANGFIYMVLVLLIILFETLPKDDSTLTSVCGIEVKEITPITETGMRFQLVNE
jgi:hypothetical protein